MQSIFFWIYRNDYIAPLCALLLTFLGLLLLVSIAHGQTNESYFLRQSMMAILAVSVTFLILWSEPSFWHRYHWLFYGLCLILLLLVLFVGTSSKGAQRWLSLGGFSLQPSEPTKLFTLLSLSAYLAKQSYPLTTKQSLTAGFILALPCSLIVLQPDLGTALSILITGSILMFLAGTPLRLFFLAGASGLCALYFGLHEYQWDRIKVFLNPEADPTGAGWNIIQSKIAIGSGSLFGKGLYQGSLKQLEFVPEQHTDFIFTVLGEEFGFLGVCCLLTLFALFIGRILLIARANHQPFFYYSTTAIGILFAVHVFTNVGMVIGILPVTGLPLPFLSFGGTALWTNWTAVALASLFYSRRPLLENAPTSTRLNYTDLLKMHQTYQSSKEGRIAKIKAHRDESNSQTKASLEERVSSKDGELIRGEEPQESGKPQKDEEPQESGKPQEELKEEGEPLSKKETPATKKDPNPPKDP